MPLRGSRTWFARNLSYTRDETFGAWRWWCLLVACAAPLVAPLVAYALSPALVFVVAVSRRPYRPGGAGWVALALTGWNALTALWSVDVHITLFSTLNLAIYVAVFVGLRSSAASGRGPGDVIAVAAGYLLGALGLAARMVHLYLVVPDGTRLNLPDVNANYAAYSFCLGLPVLLVLHRYVRLRFWVIGAVCAVLLGGIYLSGSRAALVTGAAFGAWVLASRLLRRPPFVALLVAVTVSSLIVSTPLIDHLARPVEAIFGRDTGDWSGRLVLWPEARALWADHVLVGSGAYTSTVQNSLGIPSHNFFLETGSGSGAVGLAIFVAVFVLALRGRERRLIAGAWISAATFCYVTGSWELAGPAWISLALVHIAVDDPGADEERVKQQVAEEDQLAAEPSTSTGAREG